MYLSLGEFQFRDAHQNKRASAHKDKPVAASHDTPGRDREGEREGEGGREFTAKLI